MFACGPHTAKATAAQVIPISRHDQQIDKGHIAMDFSVRIAAKGTDKGWATLTFLDAKGKRIGSRTSVVAAIQRTCTPAPGRSAVAQEDASHACHAHRQVLPAVPTVTSSSMASS